MTFSGLQAGLLPPVNTADQRRYALMAYAALSFFCGWRRPVPPKIRHNSNNISYKISATKIPVNQIQNITQKSIIKITNHLRTSGTFNYIIAGFFRAFRFVMPGALHTTFL